MVSIDERKDLTIRALRDVANLIENGGAEMQDLNLHAETVTIGVEDGWIKTGATGRRTLTVVYQLLRLQKETPAQPAPALKVYIGDLELYDLVVKVNADAVKRGRQ